jgi:DNA-binding NtrC family response regulator
MGHNLFLIEHFSSSHLPAWIAELELRELAITRRVPWESFAPEVLTTCQEQIVVADAVPQNEDAVRMFHWLQEHPIQVPTLAILPGESAELVRLAAACVDDFLVLPIHAEEFRQRLLRLLGPVGNPASLEKVGDRLIGEVGLRQAIGQAPEFLEAIKRVLLFAPNNAPVLLTGETGTGKELFARLLHLLSPRRKGPFIPVECGAIPEQLFENEMFGHARGAFTDAQNEQKGCVGLAQGGTLFLDEIDCLSLAGQGKLLRLLQEGKYRPLGAEQFRDADVRIIAASNREIAKLVDEKLFRRDLFFRLDVLRMHLPPLRERPCDISLLARHFSDSFCEANGMRKKVLSPASLRKLERHHWPGNVRELYNTIQRAVLTAHGPEITSSQIEIEQGRGGGFEEVGTFQSAKNAAIQRFEREFVQQLLDRHRGNITHAAREAQKDRRAFGRLAKKYGLKSPAA